MVKIIDTFLTGEEAKQLQKMAIDADYQDWEGPGGVVYKRISIVDNQKVHDRLTEIYGEIDMLGMAFRADQEGHKTTQSIHTDVGWGTHALVLYLNDGDSGTAFWKHKASGRIELPKHDINAYIDTRKDWLDESKWEIYDEVQMKFNRAALYESQLFHSRWPFEGFGTSTEDCRLVLVAFFTPTGEENETIHT